MLDGGLGHAMPARARRASVIVASAHGWRFKSTVAWRGCGVQARSTAVSSAGGAVRLHLPGRRADTKLPVPKTLSFRPFGRADGHFAAAGRFKHAISIRARAAAPAARSGRDSGRRAMSGDFGRENRTIPMASSMNLAVDAGGVRRGGWNCVELEIGAFRMEFVPPISA